MTKAEALEALKKVSKEDKRSVFKRLKAQLEAEGYEIQIELDGSVYDQ